MSLESSEISLMQRLLGSIAHDISNPLSALKMTSQISIMELEGQDGMDEILENFHSIEEASDKIETLINELRKFAYSGKPSFEYIDPSQIIESVVNSEKENFPSVKFNILTKHNNKKFKIIPFELKKAFSCILDNSLESMTNSFKKEINIEINNNDPEYITIIFNDSGEGMNKSTKESSLKPFFSTKENANGLGLTIAKGIIRIHQGLIDIHSEESKGTSVIISLPINSGT